MQSGIDRSDTVLSQTPLKCVVRPDREGNCTLKTNKSAITRDTISRCETVPKSLLATCEYMRRDEKIRRWQ